MPRYKIESLCNGAFWTITRLSDGKSAFLQGDIARCFERELDATYASCTDDDICDAYDTLLE